MECLVPDALRGGASLSRKPRRRRVDDTPCDPAHEPSRTRVRSGALLAARLHVPRPSSSLSEPEASCREGATERTRDTQTRPQRRKSPPLPPTTAPLVFPRAIQSNQRALWSPAPWRGSTFPAPAQHSLASGGEFRARDLTGSSDAPRGGTSIYPHTAVPGTAVPGALARGPNRIRVRSRAPLPNAPWRDSTCPAPT